MGKQVGRHLRDGEQRDDQHDSHDAQAGHNSQGDEHHQQVFKPLYRYPLRAGKLAVEGHVNNGATEEDEKQVAKSSQKYWERRREAEK